MSDFIEFIKKEHQKLLGKPKKSETAEHNIDNLQHDSIEELTDLEEDGILTNSQHLLTVLQRERLLKVSKEMGKQRNKEPKKHDCGYGLSTASNVAKQTSVEFELKKVSPATVHAHKIIASG